MGKLIINSRYGTTPNEILNHKEISLKAKGLYGFLQCKPDNWDFSTERIAAQIKESEKVVRGTLQELERFSLLIRKKRPKDDKGKWTGYDYILQETVVPKPSLPKAVGRIKGSTENGEDISKQDYSKQDIVINIDTAKHSFADTVKEHSKEIQEIFNLFYEINPTINFGNKTQRKSAEEMIKKFGYERTIGTVKFAISVQGRKYAPTITNPLELKNNMGKLLTYYKREQEPSKGSMPIFKL